MAMQSHHQAMSTLQSIRRRLTDRLADRIVASTEKLKEKAAFTDDPLGACPDLEVLCFGLTRVNNVIASLRAVTATGDAAPAADRADRTFGPLCEMVAAERFEDASRRLSQLVRLPLDRSFTATRFFGRALKADPSIARQLGTLCTDIEQMPVPRAMEILVAAFGLQAVESSAAIHALRERARALSESRASAVAAV